MDLYSKIADLRRRGESFALATVVMRQAPVSSHLGDKALIFEDGRIEGYVGGACSREIVRKQALEALQAGKPRLVKITPQVAAQEILSRADEVVIPMTCASEGAVEVYIEPQGSPSVLLVVGASRIAVATAHLAGVSGYPVTLACEASELEGVPLGDGVQVIPRQDLGDWLTGRNPTRTGVVVASQGHYDEDALAVILRAMPRPSYLGLVASRKRGNTVLETLEVMGVPRATLAPLKFPAGLDLGGQTPEEVALSILAEMVALKRGKRLEAPAPTAVSPSPAPPAPASTVALDPVCGMSVEIASARHRYEFEGQLYYFCCPHCKAKFQKDPSQYLSQGSSV